MLRAVRILLKAAVAGLAAIGGTVAVGLVTMKVPVVVYPESSFWPLWALGLTVALLTVLQLASHKTSKPEARSEAR